MDENRSAKLSWNGTRSQVRDTQWVTPSGGHPVEDTQWKTPCEDLNTVEIGCETNVVFDSCHKIQEVRIKFTVNQEPLL